MLIEIKVPSPGESITEVQLASWLVKDGDFVDKDAELAEIDSDKATLTVNAEAAGKITILAEAGATLAVGSVIARIDTQVAANKQPSQSEAAKVVEQPAEATMQEKVAEPIKTAPVTESKLHISPLARRVMEDKELSERDVLEHFRITRKDVLEVAEQKSKGKPDDSLSSPAGSREEERRKMSTLRIKLSKRLVAVKNETAMLTTFNEVDMSAILGLKKQFNDAFKEKYGVGIGFMSFFTKAVTVALEQYPQVNAMIDGEDLIFHKYADIGIAVGAPKGLVVPVIRNAESLTLAGIELRIKELAGKARDNKLTLEEMSGGTFTITNGGVFGSMMSTPILNPPQSAILGMHNIIERPVARNGQVVIAPMMYLALSYDHRVIDGRESVSFLVKVKELLESPSRMLFGGNDPIQVLLGV